MNYNPHPEDRLTDSEIAVLKCAALGCSRAETGQRIGYGSDRIKQLRLSLFSKLHARNAAHAVALAFCHGILGADDCAEAVGE